MHEESIEPRPGPRRSRVGPTAPPRPPWNKGGPQTLEAIVADYSPGPTLVAPILGGFLSPCPSNACSDPSRGPCDTVVYVRIGEDAYVGYALSGGP
jgi:hypothetical protein